MGNTFCAICKVVLIVEMRDAMTKKLVGYWALMTRRAWNAMPSCRTQCDLQDRADADFYTLMGVALLCSSATTARPWGLVSYLPDHSFDSLPMHYQCITNLTRR